LVASGQVQAQSTWAAAEDELVREK